MKNNKDFMSIYIKGRQYVLIAKNEIDNGDTLGEINYTTKQISISKDSLSQLDHVILHELIHGFFHECGMRDWSANETLINWIAHNIRDIMDVYDEIKHSPLYKNLLEHEYNHVME